MKIFSKSMVILVRIQNGIIKYSIKLTCQESESTYSYGFSVICFSDVLFKLYSLMFKRTNTKEDLKLSLVALNSQDYVLWFFSQLYISCICTLLSLRRCKD